MRRPPDSRRARPTPETGSRQVKATGTALDASSISAGAQTSGERRRPPTAYVSLFVPAQRRRWWHYWYTCRRCGTYQLGRAPRLEDVTGTRRAGCGHQVRITVARVYGGDR
jgi:hypothetical protein